MRCNEDGLVNEVEWDCEAPKLLADNADLWR